MSASAKAMCLTSVSPKHPVLPRRRHGLGSSRRCRPGSGDLPPPPSPDRGMAPGARAALWVAGAHTLQLELQPFLRVLQAWPAALPTGPTTPCETVPTSTAPLHTPLDLPRLTAMNIPTAPRGRSAAPLAALGFACRNTVPAGRPYSPWLAVTQQQCRRPAAGISDAST